MPGAAAAPIKSPCRTGRSTISIVSVMSDQSHHVWSGHGGTHEQRRPVERLGPVPSQRFQVNVDQPIRAGERRDILAVGRKSDDVAQDGFDRSAPGEARQDRIDQDHAVVEQDVFQRTGRRQQVHPLARIATVRVEQDQRRDVEPGIVQPHRQLVRQHAAVRPTDQDEGPRRRQSDDLGGHRLRRLGERHRGRRRIAEQRRFDTDHLERHARRDRCRQRAVDVDRSPRRMR